MIGLDVENKPRASGAVHLPVHPPGPGAILSCCPPPDWRRGCYLGCMGADG